MSFVDGNQAPAVPDEQQEQEPVEGQPVEEQQEPEGSGELANPFLENIPEEDRPVVAKYAKQWDAGVTRRFQELHNTYRPYKELGEVEELQRAIAVANYIRDNPQELYSMLHEQYGQNPQQQQQVQPFNAPQQPGTQNPSLNGLPEELQPLAQLFEQQYGAKLTESQEKMAQIEKTLEIVANHVISQLTESTQQREDRELQEYMDNLHTEFGDFDDQYVLALMANGAKADDAIKRYKDVIQKQVNATRAPTPPQVLSGGGGAPSISRKPEELSSKETQELVAQVLARSHEAQ